MTPVLNVTSRERESGGGRLTDIFKEWQHCKVGVKTVEAKYLEGDSSP